MIPHVRSLIAYNAESKVVESMRPNGVLLGQATAGACGTVSNCLLPGGIMLSFTARSVSAPHSNDGDDGRAASGDLVRVVAHLPVCTALLRVLVG